MPSAAVALIVLVALHEACEYVCKCVCGCVCVCICGCHLKLLGFGACPHLCYVLNERLRLLSFHKFFLYIWFFFFAFRFCCCAAQQPAATYNHFYFAARFLCHAPLPPCPLRQLQLQLFSCSRILMLNKIWIEFADRPRGCVAPASLLLSVFLFFCSFRFFSSSFLLLDIFLLFISNLHLGCLQFGASPAAQKLAAAGANFNFQLLANTTGKGKGKGKGERSCLFFFIFLLFFLHSLWRCSASTFA